MQFVEVLPSWKKASFFFFLKLVFTQSFYLWKTKHNFHEHILPLFESPIGNSNDEKKKAKKEKEKKKQ